MKNFLSYCFLCHISDAYSESLLCLLKTLPVLIMGSSAVSKRSGKHCVFVHDIKRGSQCIVGRFQIDFSFGQISFV